MTEQTNQDQVQRRPRSRTDIKPVVFTTNTFCDSHEISRTTLYRMWSKGRGPRFYRQGDQRRITAEAAAEWRALMEATVA